ncbi:hypothetical protein TWF730_007277 [Orbilia blumenaviensis]|uniref:C2H2-type domain-containing protein n=1 Tax=Orbilia blumenaviensis TaxID=1796055 RepID=A0AAV9V793_9PEZI
MADFLYEPAGCSERNLPHAGALDECQDLIESLENDFLDFSHCDEQSCGSEPQPSTTALLSAPSSLDGYLGLETRDFLENRTTGGLPFQANVFSTEDIGKRGASAPLPALNSYATTVSASSLLRSFSINPLSLQLSDSVSTAPSWEGHSFYSAASNSTRPTSKRRRNKKKKGPKEPQPCTFPTCNEVLADKDTLSSHIKNMHEEKKRITCKYPGCGHEIKAAERKGKGNMKRHQDKCHVGWTEGKNPEERCDVASLVP